jgi:hypothetical protein
VKFSFHDITYFEFDKRSLTGLRNNPVMATDQESIYIEKTQGRGLGLSKSILNYTNFYQTASQTRL